MLFGARKEPAWSFVLPSQEEVIVPFSLSQSVLHKTPSTMQSSAKTTTLKVNSRNMFI